MITDYASLQATIGQWLARSDMATAAPDLIQMAEVRIGRELQRMQHRRLMVSVSGTLVAGSAALPADFVTIRSVEVPWGAGNLVLPPLDSTTQESTSSQPLGYWIDGNNLRITGGGVSPYTLNYWQRLPSIATATSIQVQTGPSFYAGGGTQAGRTGWWVYIADGINSETRLVTNMGSADPRTLTVAALTYAHADITFDSTVVIDQVTRGATSVADNATITHGHPKIPAGVLVTTSVADEWASVPAADIGATTFKVQLTKHDNTAGTTQVVYWQAFG